MIEDIKLNGISLNTMSFAVPDMSGLMSVPSRRGSDVVVPGRHGAIRTPHKRFETAEYTLPLWIVGCNPDGSVPAGSSEAAQFWANRDLLLQQLYSPSLTVTFVRSEGTAVSAQCEVVEAVDFTRVNTIPVAKVSVVLVNTSAFWAEASTRAQSVTGVTGSVVPLTEFAGSTAPIEDTTVTFYGPVNNPQLIHGGYSVQYGGTLTSGQQLVINSGNWQVTPGTGSTWAPNLRQVSFSPGPRWFEINPAVQPFSVTFIHTTGSGVSASCVIAGRRKFLSA